MIQPRSEQERRIQTLSARLLGNQLLFHPPRFKTPSGSHEPSDLAWVAQRCAVLMYMKDGNKPFERKRTKNFSQMRGWLRKWQSGYPLETGNDEDAEFSYEDIDQIVGLSIVDGRGAMCCFEPEVARSMVSDKVAGCITITNGVFEKLTNSCVGIRDVLSLMRMMRTEKKLIPETEIIEWIDKRSRLFVDSAHAKLGYIAADIFTEAWIFVKTAMDKSKETSGIADVLADLTLNDVIMMSACEAALRVTLQESGERGASVCTWLSEPYRIRVISATDIKAMGQHIDKITDDSIHLVLASNFIIDGLPPMRLFAISPDMPKLALHSELEELRQKLIT